MIFFSSYISLKSVKNVFKIFCYPTTKKKKDKISDLLAEVKLFGVHPTLLHFTEGHLWKTDDIG